RIIYTASRNPSVIKMMNELEFIMFETLFTLPEAYKKYELHFIIRTLKWARSSYRVKEIIRKILTYGYSKKFVYGIKDYRQ
ncbi:MAG: N-acetyltransferase, partial [Rhizonema sp. NSF051]|nr:N-acetyltransferase [Rhizonema sp. NSF051]